MRLIVVYVCDCGCFHGWKEDDAGIVRLVTRHTRGAMEDIWWCPACGREHRTHDGSAMGQVHKAWRDATGEEFDLIEKGTDPRAHARGEMTIGPDGTVWHHGCGDMR